MKQYLENHRWGERVHEKEERLESFQKVCGECYGVRKSSGIGEL